MQDGIVNAGAGFQENFQINLDALDGTGVGADGGNGSGQQGAGDQKFDVNSIEIDDKFKSLDPIEARFRTLQSQKDHFKDTLTQREAELMTYKNYKELLNDLMTKEDALLALVNQVNPNLIAKRDVSVEIKQRLGKEFGENYKPELSRADADKDPGSKDWLYYRKADQIANEVLNNQTGYAKFKDLEEYKKSLANESATAEQALFVEIEEAKKRFNASDQEVQGVVKWGNGLKVADLIRINRFLRNFKDMKGISQVAGAGGNSQQPSQSREAFLKSIKK